MAAEPPAGFTQVGKGRYATVLRAGGEHEPPAAMAAQAHRSGPVPTNQWYSSLFFSPWAQPLYAFPLSYRPQPEGWQIDIPKPLPVLNGVREENDIVATHQTALLVRPTSFPLSHSYAGKVSDWSVDVVMGDDEDALTATVVRGSPFGYYTITRGGVEIEATAAPVVFYESNDGRTLGLSVRDRAFALFAPGKCSWQRGTAATRFVLRAPAGSTSCEYFSIAALPEPSAEIAETFRRYAFSFVTDTRTEYQYDEKQSEVVTRFVASIKAMEGAEQETLLGLLPHHVSGLSASVQPEGHTFGTIRGPLRLYAGHEFRTTYRYHGILPWWPKLKSAPASKRLRKFLAADMRFGADQLLGNRGTYWEGKGLNRAAQVMAIAEQAHSTADRNALLAAIKSRLQLWFAPEQDAPRYFYYNKSVGSLIGYPDEYGSASELNDHHFHYGYWISAAAQVALRDAHWASHSNWGGMVDLMIGDIASPVRNDMFPKLRHFDAYEGHSWASGLAPFYDGNNQESSSEAINAWAGMILWGEATGNRQIRDTGIYLYTTEVQAANHYWFDLSHQVLSPEYTNTHASIVWGSKYAHATWFTDEPRQTLGINVLPITTASLYLGVAPENILKNIDATTGEFDRFLARDGRASRDVWQDILLSYGALSDPQAALKQWDPEGAVEDGETRTHTYFWLESLAELGRPDFGVTADTALFGAFKRADGIRTYLAYNSTAQPRQVTFSDGIKLRVAPHSLGRLKQKKRQP